MASIIKADTLQSTTSNVFVLNSAGTEYARFDSSGVFQLANPTTFPAGTAALPSITATGDTNTGLYFPAADTIAFATAGTEDMRIDSSGNVMIGTTTSQVGAKLAVTGGIQGTITSGTANTTLSGTSIDFTSIPSWVKRITVMLSNVSTSGTSNFLIQIGDSGGVEITGYSAALSRIGGAGASNSTSTAGWLIQNAVTAAGTFLATAQITLLDSATNTWSCFGTSNSAEGGNSGCLYNGSKATSATLDRVRITTVNGTDTFDAGSINILYEG